MLDESPPVPSHSDSGLCDDNDGSQHSEYDVRGTVTSAGMAQKGIECIVSHMVPVYKFCLPPEHLFNSSTSKRTSTIKFLI